MTLRKKFEKHSEFLIEKGTDLLRLKVSISDYYTRIANIFYFHLTIPDLTHVLQTLGEKLSAEETQVR